ncbi:hypothetical protein PV08_04736 [Exophiala spinifera]|uniref:Short-chain dehydrogenase n=1 Tax=Exophiala spinifera TaxID=91928 RepID=A0A0D1ZY45_9EURO|nr:uncharacterized protein PV08_04736 [Exophiala spinifera]KIW17542.1 hypothetical protein PV08_04736 [Exophiala spinifera]
MTGRVVFLTGANGGIGYEITKQFLAQPVTKLALVVAIDLHVDRLRGLLPEHEGRLEVIAGDISDRATSEAGVAAAISRSGRLDSIILNAGIQGPVGSMLTVDVAAWKRVMDINFFALVHSIQVAAPHLHKTGGTIIMTTSGVSLGPFPEWSSYGSSKAAMNYINLCWQKEDPTVRSVCVRPGIVDTGMQTAVRTELKDDLPKSTYEWLKGVHDRGELLSPDVPAKTFVYFALKGIPDDMVSTIVDYNDGRVNFDEV